MTLAPPLSIAFATALGLILGSFANVTIARLPRGRSIVTPRSHCPRCKKMIAWYDNVPLVSYGLLLGRCRHCKKPISPRYPLVEALVAVVFLAATLRYGLTPLTVLRDFPFLLGLVCILFIDVDHRIIPDEFSLGGMVWGLLTSFAFPWLLPFDSPQLSERLVTDWMQAFAGAALGFGLFYGLAWTYAKVRGRTGLGGGDVKLLGAVGAFLGVQGVLATVLVSSVTGSVLGILLAVTGSRSKKGFLQLKIPFGPFMVLGAMFYYFLGDLLWLPLVRPQ